jgi:signal transduction histidine kinase/CheY-like chemotaxis protein
MTRRTRDDDAEGRPTRGTGSAPAAGEGAADVVALQPVVTPASAARRRFWWEASIQTKMLAIILPLVVLPVLVLATVGFVTAHREAAKAEGRYLSQREADLRALAENPAISNYASNRAYGLTEEAEVARRELEDSFKRFADRGNSVDLVYPAVRYVDPDGEEIAKVVEGEIRTDRGRVTEAPFFAAVGRLGPDRPYLSPVAPRMTYAMPVYQPSDEGQPPAFLGVVVLDFVYPIQDFQRTTAVIGRTFLLITGISLGIAVLLTVNRVRRLTHPVRRLAEAANRLAAGQRRVAVAIDAGDEIGRLGQAFNEMAESLGRNEAALERKVHETQVLQRIGQEISARVALEPTLQLIADRARDLLQAEECLLALREGESDTFAVKASSGSVSEGLAQRRFRAGDHGVGGRVALTAEPVIVHDYRDEYPDSPHLAAVQAAGIRSQVAAPLKTRETVIGVLLVQSRTPAKFREDDRRLLSALADQAAIAIESARLFEQVRQYAEELEAKVEVRTRQLQEANRQLETASRHKSEFLASMSHELRTPLNAIIGFSRLVMRRSRDVLPARQYENLEKILVSAEHLLALINDILDLSKIEAGRVEVRAGAFDVEPLVDLCLRTVEPLVKSERVRLAKAVDGDLPRLHTDQDKVKQILINLLSNAVKFTDEGTITVTVARRGHDVALAVADSGIGIPADQLELIFEEFRQVDSGNTRKRGGTGLGLAISRRFARLLGGDLTVASTPGAGSVFTLRLPPRYEAAPSATRPGAALPEDSRPGPDGRRLILAIDDDPDAIYLLQENLAEAGYRVVGALGADEGLQKAHELRPFAITLDITMPQRNGWEVLHALKSDPATRDIPVIVVSIVDGKELGYRLGAADYLLKPFDREAIVAVLGRMPSPPSRLLVVDDDPQVVDLVRQLLEGEPYEVAAAADGEEALAAIVRRRPDVILLDLLMPGVDGFAVIEHLQQNAGGRTIPVIVLTARRLEPAERSWLEQSVVKVVQKLGLDRETFLRDLQDALGNCSRRAG